MKPIDADKLKELYPNRKSLNTTLDNAPMLSITSLIEDVKRDMCDNYCKIPFKYSSYEWEQIQFSEDSPCFNCPLNKL